MNRSFIFFDDYYKNLQYYDEANRLKLYAAIIDFSCGRIEPNFDENSELFRVWLWIKHRVEVQNDADRYDDLIPDCI